MKSHSRYEGGQAIVLLVISLVVLLGFTALALDGGMVYSDRRVAQNAADTAALAGGGAVASGLEEYLIQYDGLFDHCNPISGKMDSILRDAESAAILRAGTNSFSIDRNLDDGNYAIAECIISGNDRYIKVRTSIVTETQTSFAHLLFSGPLRNSVEAETIIYPTSALYYGNSIVALKRDACPGVDIRGGSTIELTGGGVYSNGCIRGNGNSSTTVHNGSINFMTYLDRTTEHNVIFSPPPEQGANYLPAVRLPEPNCSLVPESDTPSQTGNSNLTPGRYTEIRKNSGDLILAPGLYCVHGDFMVNTNNNVTGNGVTIFMFNPETETSGNLFINGSAIVNLSAPADCDGSNGCPPAQEGMLIYNVTGNVELVGSAVWNVTGTIYAPLGNVQLGGTSNATNPEQIFHVQVIGGTVNLRGNAGVEFVFNRDEQVSIPANMSLYK